METALLDARRGNSERACARLQEARRLFDQSGNGSMALLVDARTAEALGMGGEHGRATELATRALERAVDEEASALVLPVLNRVLGEAYLLAGRTDAARAALERAVDEANRVEHRYEEALALDALVRVNGSDGATDEVGARRDDLFRRLGIVAVPAKARPPVESVG
jgi:ATP/maltotriose-dependent transcriptional regulator MalT